MENYSFDSIPNNELSKEEKQKSVEQILLSEQEKNIQKVFTLNPELKQAVYDALGIENDTDIAITLGRSKESYLGRIQNINVLYKGEVIIDSDNSTDNKLYLVTKEDGTSYVGDILIPTELQGKGLGLRILQKVADDLDTKIIPAHLSVGDFTSDNAKKMWEKAGNEILPNHEAEKTYAKYLETIFPESKVKDIVYHRTKSEKFEKFNNKTESYVNQDTYTKDGIYFNNDIHSGKEIYGKNVVASVVNIKNPYLFIEENLFEKEGDNPKNLSLNSIRREQLDEGEDGILFKPNKKNGQTIVFEPEQIHILGSQADIEKFKEFVSKK